MIEKLRAYGADIEGALERFMGDEELYDSCIKLLLEEEAFDQLDRAIKEKYYKSAFEAAHTLKGVLGNLGLTPIFNSTSDIVELLRLNDVENIDEEYKKWLLKKEELLTIIKK